MKHLYMHNIHNIHTYIQEKKSTEYKLFSSPWTVKKVLAVSSPAMVTTVTTYTPSSENANEVMVSRSRLLCIEILFLAWRAVPLKVTMMFSLLMDGLASSPRVKFSTIFPSITPITLSDSAVTVGGTAIRHKEHQRVSAIKIFLYKHH